MSKLYEALKRLEQTKKPPINNKYNKKPDKKNIKWIVLFFVSILVGSLLIHISNFIGKAPPKKSQNAIKIYTQNTTNSTNYTNSINSKFLTKQINATNSTKSPILKSVSEKTTNKKITIQSKPSCSQQISATNQTKTESTKENQLKNVLHFQQEKAEKLSTLALNINNSIENGDYYRAKLLLKEYLSIQEDPFALNDLAAIYIKEGQYLQAVKLLQKSIKQNPSAAAYINIIYCYKKLNDTNKLNEILKTINPSMFNDTQKAIINEIINSK
ncbi:M48 family metallopeptidase [Desulfurella sp.]|uniref:tetratricopeptide repeat protein n=1 Tax=Desulfurella sp. TaxID=1962857 RepID=UPI0025BED633|nr:tetratricopeptide repeat protein [Desulfurella sp.]